MKKDYTHISFVLDRSGSMASIKADTIGGFNEFLKKQKEVPGQATFSLTQFDTEFQLVYSFLNIGDVPELNVNTFIPRGGTALYDAIGLAIDGCGGALAALREEERPDKVIFVILTDGEENSSGLYKYSQIQEMIKHQSEFYKWEFVFLGANINAETVGTGLGIKLGNSMTFAANSAGTQAMFLSMGEKLNTYRMSDCSTVQSDSYSFFDADDKKQQREAGA